MSRLKLKIHETLNPKSPWLVQNAVIFMDHYLRPEDRVLEFGAGRSTAWFLHKECRVTSIETNENWFEHVRQTNRSFIDSGSLDLRRTYEIDPDIELFDCILIDGGDREEAAKIAFRVVKPGGIIVFDNIERYMPTKIRDTPSHVLLKRETMGFQKLHEDYKKLRNIVFSNGITQTAVFFKNV